MKIRQVILALFGLLSLALWGAEFKVSPINPAYTRWMVEKAKAEVAAMRLNTGNVEIAQCMVGKSSVSSEFRKKCALGVVPSLIDYGYLTNTVPQVTLNSGGLSMVDALPQKYDLRDDNRVTPVRDQNPYGTCWAHATLGSLESLLLGEGKGAYNFSEKHLANMHGRGNGFNAGGNATMAIAYLSRLSGPIAETEDPYPGYSYYTEWVKAKGGEYDYGPKSVKLLTVSESPKGTPIKYALNVAQLTPMKSASDTAALNAIKEAVRTYGGVYVSYTHSWSAFDDINFYNDGTYSADGGHAVLIVGWDDSYSKDNFTKLTPPGNGAFLVKNSWGDDLNSLGGYCWFSYYDSTFARGELFSFRSCEDVENYNGVYGYDRLGRVLDFGNGETAYGANIFTAGIDENISAVGVYANKQNTSYDITIYTGCAKGVPCSGTKALTQSGTLGAGFFTVKLDSPVHVQQGERFSVVMKLRTPGYTLPLACYFDTYSYDYLSDDDGLYYYLGGTWTSNGNYNGDWYFDDNGNNYKWLPDKGFYLMTSTGQGYYSAQKYKYSWNQLTKHKFDNTIDSAIASGLSFYSEDGTTWTDLKTVELSDSSEVHIVSGSARFCCKVYTTESAVEPDPPAAPQNFSVSDSDGILLSWDSVDGATQYRIYRNTQSSKPSSVYKTITVSGNIADDCVFADDSANVGTTYYYWVSAYGEGGEGEYAGPKSGKINIELTISKTSDSFGESGGDGTLSVDANYSWTATKDASWITIDKTSGSNDGKIGYSVEANAIEEERVGHITVSAGAIERILTITQSAKTPDPSSPELAHATGMANGLELWTGGDVAWFAVTNEDTFADNGIYIRSGAAKAGEISWIETKVSGAGTLKYRYDVDGMNDYAGTLVVLVDGTEKCSYEGSLASSWSQATVTVSGAGDHVVRWEFRQSDNGMFASSSYAKIDDIEFGTEFRPSTPRNAEVSSSVSGVTISWSATWTDTVELKIYRAESLNGAKTCVHEENLEDTGSYTQYSWKDDSAVIGVTYYYWISAGNDIGTTIVRAGAGMWQNAEFTLATNCVTVAAVAGEGTIAATGNVTVYPTANVNWITFDTYVGYIGISPDWTKELEIDFYAEDWFESSSREGVVTLKDGDGNVVGSFSVIQEGLSRHLIPDVYYVDASTGSDANTGKTPTSAKATIQGAIDAAISGDEIIVAPGTYGRFSVSDKVDLSIHSVDGATATIIDGLETKPGPEIHGITTTVIGFTIQNCKGSALGGQWSQCVFKNNSGRSGGAIEDAELHNCLLHHNTSTWWGGATYECDIYNCTIVSNSAASNAGGVEGGNIYNSIVWENYVNGELSNIIYADSTVCCMTQDPGLIISGDSYTLASDSPCLNAGDNQYVTTDCDLYGNTRIGNKTVDIGAYEAPTSIPTAPACSFEPVSSENISINIGSVYNADEYVIYRSTGKVKPSVAYDTFAATGSAFVYTDTTGVEPGKNYTYWIASRNDSGEGPYVKIGTTYRLVALSVAPQSMSVSADGGQKELGVTTSGRWKTFANQSWIAESPLAGNGNGTVICDFDVNRRVASRNGTISIVAGWNTDHPVTSKVEVVQSASLPIALADALGAEGSPLEYETDWQGGWFGQSEFSHDGESAARSGIVDVGNTSTMFTVVEGYGNISFWWLLDSSESGNRLVFKDGDTELAALTDVDGSSGWQFVTIDLSGDTHDLSWVYEHNGICENCEDAGFVDDVIWGESYAPQTPSFTATSNRTDCIRLKITAVSDASSYRIYRSLTSSMPQSPIAECEPTFINDSFIFDDAVENVDTWYYYWITAVNDVGESESGSPKRGKRIATPVIVRTVTFDANGGVCTTVTKEVADGSPVGELPTATYDGYHFDGWYTGKTDGDLVTVDTTVTKDVTWYAHWSVVPSEPTMVKIAKPQNAGDLVYSGSEQNGVSFDARLVIDGVTSATDSGAYAVTFSLPVNTSLEVFKWADDTTDDVSINWTIAQRAITLTSASDSKVYDGTPLANSTVAVTEGSFVTGEGFSYTVTGSQTDVGSSANTFTYSANAGTKISNYAVTKIEGTLTVTSALVTDQQWDENDVVTKDETMIVYAVVSNRQTKVGIEAPGSQLAAFAANGELRGVAEGEVTTRGWRFQLNVHVASASEAGFSFKVWNAATGEVSDIPETLDCNSDKQIGAFKAPHVFYFGYATCVVTLKEGWTWISPSVTMDDMTVGTALSGLTFAEDDVIKSSGKIATYCDGVWNPSSFKLQPGVCYMVRKGSGGTETVTFTGSSAASSVSVKAGWNWIGSPLTENKKVSDVAHSSGFAEDDIIKSSAKSTTYCDGLWQPSSFVMAPGLGYKARFANAGTLSFGVSTQANSLSGVKTESANALLLNDNSNASPWSEDDVIRQDDTMIVYLTVSNAEKKVYMEAVGSVVAAFAANGELRGVATIEFSETRGWRYQLNVHVASASEVGFSFKMWDAATGNVYDLADKLDCNEDKQIGTFKIPYVMVRKVLSPNDIQDVLAGATDGRLAECITNSSACYAYLDWAATVTNSSGAAVGAEGVKGAEHAWFSFAVGSPVLITEPPTADDIKVEEFTPSSESGKFDFSVSVDGVTIGSEALKENLKQVFGLEGSTTLNEDDFSSSKVDITFGTPENGKVKFTAGPNGANADSDTFFMKVKVTP